MPLTSPVNLPNVFENLQEAHFRLLRTIVLYDKIPYSVAAITNHKEDGIFRVYLDPIDWDGSSPKGCPAIDQHTPTNPMLGQTIDNFLLTPEGKASRMLRKQINSPMFDKFRPFPLGMCNHGCRTYYIEWSPMRQQFQGLTSNAVVEVPVSMKASNGLGGGRSVELYSPAFAECIRGDHPTAKECLHELNDPATENEAHAFGRDFAFVKGPCDIVFMAYKSEIIGVLPTNSLSSVRLGRNYGYCREVVKELGVFETVL